MTLRQRVALPFLVLIMLVGNGESAACQGDPLQGPIKFAVQELVVEGARPRLEMSFVTVGEYGCANYEIATRQRRKGDTIAIAIVGLASTGGLCAKAMGPAHAQVPLTLAPGTYSVAVTRAPATDWMELRVTTARLILRPVGTLAFTQPDTSVFIRPTRRSFVVSCGTPNVPELCTDFGDWLARQPGIVRQPLPAGDRIWFLRYGGHRQNDYQLFEYADDRAMGPVKRCMLHLADTLAQAVGVAVTLQTAGGQVFRAWSRRSRHEPHIPVPRRISGSRGCPK